MNMVLAYSKDFAFNAICPYYTMFPLEYPLRIIRKHNDGKAIVLDPFCGRGTTIYAARRFGLPCYGFDTSPIAIAIAKAKLASASREDVLELAKKLLSRRPRHVPSSAFFRKAFGKDTLRQLCSLREGLLAEERSTHASSILRAATLGCLHGPRVKDDSDASYFSNQMPRTFATKPDYSLKYWREHGLTPPNPCVIEVLDKKLSRIGDLDSETPGRLSNVKIGDSRYAATYRNVSEATLVITSPPYYGMRTYIQDQWLRMWFLGGETEVDYSTEEQICHRGQDAFIADLASVWTNVAKRCRKGAHLYVRFGVLPSVKSDAKEIMSKSLELADGWRMVSIRNADTSRAGKRQADTMGQTSAPSDEFDFHAVLR